MVGRYVRCVALALFLSGLSCGGTSKAPVTPTEPEPVTVLLWIDPTSGLSEVDTLMACEGWHAKGVSCYLVDDVQKADIRIYADNTKPCTPDERGLFTLARAWRGGKILFDMRCFGPAGNPDRHRFRTVMTHEIGHELGIWDHVPFDCEDGNAKIHPSGVPICGRAVMNPMYDAEVDVITRFDSLAFDIRDLVIAVAGDRSPEGDPQEPDCTYYGR